MLCAQRKGKCNIFRGKTNLSVGAPADMPHGEKVFLLYLKQTAEYPLIQRCAAGGEKCPASGREEWPPSGGGGVPVFTGGNAVPTARGKRGQGHRMVPLPPLDSPQTLLCAATPCGRAAKRGKRGLGSVRRADFGTLLCPEVSLRYPPRITVRGHSVQGASAVAAKSSASIKC